MDADERARLRALREAATPGPWRVGRRGSTMMWIAPNHVGQLVEHHEIHGVVVTNPNNAALIVGAVNALPALLGALDAEERKRDAAEARATRAEAMLSTVAELLLEQTGTDGPTSAEHAAWLAVGEMVTLRRERDALRDVLRDALRALLERHAGRWCGVCGQPTHAVDCVVGRAERLGVTP